MIIRNAELSEKYELLKQINTKQASSEQQQPQIQHNFDAQHHSLPPISTKVDDSHLIINHNIPVASHSTTATTQDESAPLKSLRDELNEKNKVIKTLQQRINDLKKTLQKELKYQQLPNESTTPSSAAAAVPQQLSSQHQKSLTSPISPSPAHPTSSDESLAFKFNKYTTVQNGGHELTVGEAAAAMNQALKRPSTGTISSIGFMNGAKKLDDINNKYLKHVVLKFLTSREYEVHFMQDFAVIIFIDL